MNNERSTAVGIASTHGDGRMAPKLALVVPCFNEEQVLPITIQQLSEALQALEAGGRVRADSFAVFIDDGSSDTTWSLISRAVRANSARFRGIRLARNAGHQAALIAGLEYVAGKCDASISLDADLQDDLGVLEDMLERYIEGAELVLGVRDARDTDTWFKRITAVSYYRLMRWLGVDLQENHADFRLMSSRALNNLRKFGEVNLFLRGIVPLLHSRYALVRYDRKSREAGATKYPLKKMLSLAWTGVTSFSTAPLRAIMYAGAAIFLVSLLLSLYAFWAVLNGRSIAGWASIVIPLYLLGGLLMLSIGVVGEYLARVFLESKGRPRYLIDEILQAEAEDERAG